MFTNIPEVKLGIVAVSRDCFPESLFRLLQYVDKNFREKILLRDFAREEGVSMNYLSGFIRQTLNQSFQEYVATVRFKILCLRAHG